MVHQRTAEPHPDKDSSVRLIHNDPSDRGSLILIRTIPKELRSSTSILIIHELKYQGNN